MEYKDIESLEDVKIYIQQGNSLNGSQIFALTRKLGKSESVIRDAMEGTLPQDADPALARATGAETQAPISFAEAKRLLNQPTSSGPKTSTPTTKEVQDFSKFGDDAEYVASAVKSLEEAKIPKTLAEGIRLLRKYDSPQPISSAEKEVVKTTKDNLNELLSNGTISQGEFNAFSNAIETIDTETVTTTTPITTSTTTTPKTTTTTTPTTTTTGTGQITNTAFTQFNNIPENGLLWNVGGNFYIVYEVPGSQGELYEGNPIYMAYELKDNDLIAAGLLTQGETAPQPNATMDQAFFDSIAIVTGNTDQLSAEIDNPFASFVETITEQSQVAPWITDPEMISLIAEAAVEGRTVSDAEWQTTNWYQTHNESEREWLRTYYEDPSTATQLTTDAQIAVANSLQAAGVSNAPEALINWVAGKYVSGEWSQTYTTEQISLFADPYATGKRDESFENYLSSTALTGVDRTTEREREVREYTANG